MTKLNNEFKHEIKNLVRKHLDIIEQTKNRTNADIKEIYEETIEQINQTSFLMNRKAALIIIPFLNTIYEEIEDRLNNEN